WPFVAALESASSNFIHRMPESRATAVPLNARSARIESFFMGSPPLSEVCSSFFALPSIRYGPGCFVNILKAGEPGFDEGHSQLDPIPRRDAEAAQVSTPQPPDFFPDVPGPRIIRPRKPELQRFRSPELHLSHDPKPGLAQ